MIVRVFRAKARPGKQDDFLEKARRLSVPLVESSKGLIAYFGGKPLNAGGNEFVMVSIWRNLEDLKSFAGEDWYQPVIPEEEKPLLAETFVHHYEVYGSSLKPEGHERTEH